MLEIKKIKKTFLDGTVALDGVNLFVKKGEFVVLLGPSGSGKTTLIKCINGLLEPDVGQIKFCGKEANDKSKKILRNNLGVVFQEFNLIENLSSLNNVLTGLLCYSNKFLSMMYLFKKKHKLKALESLDRVGLLQKAHTRVSNLSGGQKQRIGIARAIVKKPDLLLVDEPVASLDPIKSSEIMSLLLKLSKELGITVVCSLHQVNLALAYSDRIVGLANGKIVLNSETGKIDKSKIEEMYSGNLQGLSFK
mgnify:CR=1 FL=1